MMLLSYLYQLEDAAAKHGVRLLDAYNAAGITDSNYYRHRQGVHEVSEKVAVRVLHAIQRLGAKKLQSAARKVA
jgi:hypothetical protein